MNKQSLEGKTVIITGAAGAIGAATASLLDRRGALLALADIDSGGLDRAAAALSREPLCIECDVTRSDDAAKLVRLTVEKFGRLDVVVNNAGIIVPAAFENTNAEEIERQVRVNLLGALYVTRESIEPLKRVRGCIVTVASLAGIVPEPRAAVYTATKFALRGFNLTLHLELDKYGVAVSTVFPDSVDTPMLVHEAAADGSPLTFLSKPMPPARVAETILRACVERKPEYCIPPAQGLFLKIIACFPGLVTAVWPLLEKSGENKKRKFIKERGIDERK